MNSIQVKRVVITGGPGSGKSTVINALERRGFYCQPEAGRSIIQHQQQIGGHALPWQDPAAFAEQMLGWEMRSWYGADEKQTYCFYDRGVPDILGYLTLMQLPIPDHLLEAVRRFPYHSDIFLAPPWKAIYAGDAERKQSWEEAVQTAAIMADTYGKLGYRIIVLPEGSVEWRTDYILQALEEG